MKKITTTLGLVLTAALAIAAPPRNYPGSGNDQQGQPSTSPSDRATSPQARESSNSTTTATLRADASFTAEVVSVDAASKTITLRSADAPSGTAGALESRTLPVQGKAVGTLKSIASGDRVKLTCESESGVALNRCTAVTTLSKMKATTRTSSATSSSSSSTASSSQAADLARANAAIAPSLDATTGVSTQPSPMMSASGKEIAAVVVSADESSQTLTVKAPGAAAAADSRTLSVDTMAAASLRGLQSGEKVTILCRESSADLAGCSSVTSISKTSATLKTSSVFGQPSTYPSASADMSASTRSDSSDSSAGFSASTYGKELASQKAAEPAASTTTSAARIHAVVVATDATASTITVRNAAAAAAATDSLTFPVEGKAATSLKGVKAGDRVMLTCREGAGAPAAKAESATGKTGAVALNDTGWATAQSGQCAAVTEISKAAGTPHESESGSSKSKSSAPSSDAPKKSY